MFWPPVNLPWLSYEVVGFQTQAFDTTDLGSVHILSEFSIPPTSKMHAGDETKLTKDRQWAHILATIVGSFFWEAYQLT